VFFLPKSDFFGAFAGESAQPISLEELNRRFDRGDFALVAVGTLLLSDPNWIAKIKAGSNTDQLKGFSKETFGAFVLE
jgi:2,4-dienoyl-CoA reductase-like NADH-dependent reductase (Old Yellow Enzyme family)